MLPRCCNESKSYFDKYFFNYCVGKPFYFSIGLDILYFKSKFGIIIFLCHFSLKTFHQIIPVHESWQKIMEYLITENCLASSCGQRKKKRGKKKEDTSEKVLADTILEKDFSTSHIRFITAINILVKILRSLQ